MLHAMIILGECSERLIFVVGSASNLISFVNRSVFSQSFRSGVGNRQLRRLQLRQEEQKSRKFWKCLIFQEVDLLLSLWGQRMPVVRFYVLLGI